MEKEKLSSKIKSFELLASQKERLLAALEAVPDEEFEPFQWLVLKTPLIKDAKDLEEWINDLVEFSQIDRTA